VSGSWLKFYSESLESVCGFAVYRTRGFDLVCRCALSTVSLLETNLNPRRETFMQYDVIKCRFEGSKSPKNRSHNCCLSTCRGQQKPKFWESLRFVSSHFGILHVEGLSKLREFQNFGISKHQASLDSLYLTSIGPFSLT